jgi:AcrR family transcriptional regulator
MGRMEAQARTHDSRQRLLDASIEYVAENGLGDVSLRRLAAAIGTSHRMLIYHFGSKDGLVLEVVRAVERQQRAALAGLGLDLGLDESELMRRLWKRLSDPSLWAHERLFFDVYAQALGGRGEGARAFLDEVVDAWVKPVAAELARRRDVPIAVARADARLRLAVVRGLLLDLLATGDRAGVNRAHEQFISLCESALPNLE